MSQIAISDFDWIIKILLLSFPQFCHLFTKEVLTRSLVTFSLSISSSYHLIFLSIAISTLSSLDIYMTLEFKGTLQNPQKPMVRFSLTSWNFTPGPKMVDPRPVVFNLWSTNLWGSTDYV